MKTNNPDDFIITRKRKKYKFAKFANSSLCFELEEWKKQAVDVLEIGAGTGLFAVDIAARHPERTVVAVDVKADRLQVGAYEAHARGMTNIQFVRARADQIDEIAHPTVRSIWVTFPDPFPRKRSAGRRMTNKTFLSTYTKMLTSNGSLFLKHDDVTFFQWSLEQLVYSGWHLQELTFDLHESDLDDQYKFLTTYEARWLGEGKTTCFVRATPPLRKESVTKL